MTTDLIEKRLTDLESLMTDLPEILNLRHERVDTALSENGRRFDEMAGRLNLLDRQMAMLTRDVRDMRGGVTRQLIAQDGEIAAIKADVGGIKVEIGGIKTEIAGIKTEIGGIKTEVKSGFAEVLARLPN